MCTEHGRPAPGSDTSRATGPLSRRDGREPGKPDPIDALAVALAALPGWSRGPYRARELVARCRDQTEQINALDRELRDRVRVLASTLLDVPGYEVLGAAVIIGETCEASRHRATTGHGPPVAGDAAGPMPVVRFGDI
ncbi:hypothetical protein [Kutzneria buriramensis]|uniref:hypothetical protein n=1 Tax=Kutzneria buriramensis TaxID=1045776 RepID=UPI0035E6AAD9